MIRVLTMAALLASFGGVATESAFARGGSNFGVSSDLHESVAVTSFKKRQKSKEASSTRDDKRTKRKKK